jgi:hypothetical protein
MIHFCVSTKQPNDGDSYWVLADTASEARRLVARNVPEAANAEDDVQWIASLTTASLPEGVIYRKLQGPVTITAR